MNELEDYEEGSWIVPLVQPRFTQCVGKYTQVGHIIHEQVALRPMSKMRWFLWRMRQWFVTIMERQHDGR
mgnify:CR=1 FL=1